jgi:hypothetical protein
MGVSSVSGGETEGGRRIEPTTLGAVLEPREAIAMRSTERGTTFGAVPTWNVVAERQDARPEVSVSRGKI